MLDFNQFVSNLRDDVVLNSLFISDYKNRYEIEPHFISDVLDGYSEYLYNMIIESGYKDNDYFSVIHEYDNKDNLIDYINYELSEDLYKSLYNSYMDIINE